MLTPCCPFIPPPPPERPGARSGEGGGPSQSSNIGVFDHTNYLKWGWGLKSRNNRLDGSNKKVYSSSLLRWASNVCVFDHTNYLKWRWGLILTIIKIKYPCQQIIKDHMGFYMGPIWATHMGLTRVLQHRSIQERHGSNHIGHKWEPYGSCSGFGSSVPYPVSICRIDF